MNTVVDVSILRVSLIDVQTRRTYEHRCRHEQRRECEQRCGFEHRAGLNRLTSVLAVPVKTAMDVNIVHSSLN